MNKKINNNNNNNINNTLIFNNSIETSKQHCQR